MKIRCNAGAALRAWCLSILFSLSLAAPAVHAATPQFDATCSSSGTGCHITPPQGGRLNASFSSAFIAKAIADNYGPGMNTLSGVSAATLSTIATELGNYFNVSPQAATVPFQTPTSISLVGKVELGTFYAALDTINVSITAANGSASGVNTAGAEAINYTPPSCSVGAKSFTYNATSSTSGQVTSTRTINVTVSNPTTGPTFSSPPSSMNAQTNVAVSPVTFTSSCNSLVTYSLTGSLPTGMSLSSGGQVSGTPASSNPTGTYNVTIRATYPGGATTTTPFAVNLSLGPPDLSGSAATATGLEGSAFTTYQIVATNGSSFTYSATGLPPGLNVNTSTGQITGTPTVTANTGASTVYPVTIGANNGSQGNTRVVNFTINAIPVVNSAATANAQSLVPFTYTITGTKTPTSFNATGLPAWLNHSPGSSVLSGTPPVSAISGTPVTVTLTATNANGTSTPFNLDITVGQGPPIISAIPSPQSGSDGASFSYQVVTQNSPTSFNATGLPAGLSISASGLISGTIAAGAAANPSNPYNVQVTATNAAGSDVKNFTLSVSVIAPVVTSGALQNGQTGASFSYQITAANIPTSFAAGCPTTASPLPPGLSLNTSTGLISGTPTTVATSTCQVTATNGSGTSPASPLTINITLGPPTVTSGGSAGGAVGFPMSYQITATNNPTSFGASGLPPGLTVGASGLISGTPTANGTYTATVSATNATATATKSVVFTIAVGLPAITSPTSTSSATGYPFSYQIVATNGPTSYAATGLPAGVTINSATGLISGSFSAAGTYVIGLTATNATGSGTATLAVSVTQTAAGLTSATTATAAVGQVFNYVVTIVNGPALINVKGLPPGLVFDAATSTIGGTPTQGGTFNVTLDIINSAGTVTATLVINIAYAAPTAHDSALDVAYETPTPVPLSIGGQVLSLTITAQPAHGLLTINGVQVTYTPANGYSGPDSFRYTVANPGGTTSVATVSINVGTLAPIAAAMAMRCDINTSCSADLARIVKGSSLSGVSVAAQPAHGQAAVNGMVVTYTPKTDYFGTDTFSYIAYGNAGKSSPAVITVTIVGRPDPTKDANVRGLVDAQAQAARRFSAAQVNNFQRRMETLHRSPAPVAPVEAQPAETSPVAAPDANAAPADAKGKASSNDKGTGAAPSVGLMPASLMAPFVSAATSRAFDLDASTGGGGRGSATFGVNAWIVGAAQFGRRNETGDQSSLRFTTDGISIGLDKRFGDRLVLGLGFGYGRDDTSVGGDGSRSKVRGQSFALYGSFQPGGSTFVDVLAGIGKLDYDTRRHVAALDQIATGTRRGDQSFASVAAGVELRRDGVLVSPYARLDASSDKLKSYDEQGVGDYALHFDDMRVRSTQVAGGLRLETQHDADFGSVVPRVRAEYRRELQSDAHATLRYADLLDGPLYNVTSTGTSRNSLLLGVGSDFLFRGGLKLGVDYVAQRANGASNVQGVRILASLDLDRPGSPFSWQPRMFKDPVGVEAGYSYDDNVTRGRVAGEKLADSIFSLSVGEPIPYRFAALPHVRVMVTPQFTAEKFRLYQGLGRLSAGAQAELQYRSSGAFDAMTYALVARGSYDEFESSLRRGARYFGGFNVRRSLTDRIDLFAEAGRQWRDGKSEVFQTREWLGKVNLDYALGGKRGILYLAGEYRHGDSVSSGPSSLVNVGLADVFVPEDAFPGLDFLAYRFEARTAIGTVGWNHPLGARDSLDFSYRRVQSSPTGRTMWDSGTLRYIDNQYSIVYLMRF